MTAPQGPDRPPFPLWLATLLLSASMTLFTVVAALHDQAGLAAANGVITGMLLAFTIILAVER